MSRDTTADSKRLGAASKMRVRSLEFSFPQMRGQVANPTTGRRRRYGGGFYLISSRFRISATICSGVFAISTEIARSGFSRSVN